MSVRIINSDKESRKIISEKIREYRKQQKISQKELARRTGLSIATIQGYEQERFTPKISNLNKIAEVFNVSAEELGAKVTEFHAPSFMVQQMDQQMERYARVYAQFIQEPYIPFLNIIDQLNDSGKKKALEQLELLAKIPEYRQEQATPEDAPDQPE